MKLRALALSLAIPFTVAASGCYGQFNAVRKIYGWNGQVTSNKIVNSVIFWGLLIIPVYELGFLGDWLIFNPVEVLTGSNPLTLQDGKATIHQHGHEYVLRVLDGDSVEIVRDGRLLARSADVTTR